MTLDELLDLLPDNDTGQISAADMRTIVTSLHADANRLGARMAFRWTTDATPPIGRLKLTGGWALTATELVINEVSDDGLLLVFQTLDVAGTTFEIRTSTGGVLEGVSTGASVDNGAYRTVPITVSSVQSPVPVNNTLMDVQVRSA